MKAKTLLRIIPTVLSVIASVGCNSQGVAAGTANVDNLSNGTQGGAPVKSNAIGPSCKSEDPKQQCLAVKYVVYQDASGKDVVSQQESIKVINESNAIWKQCGIAFQIDEFVSAKQIDLKLSASPANNSELNEIRKTFEDNDTLLLVTTTKWNRSGSLGSTGANAWAAMPGERLYGVVLESAVGTFSNIIAHELGHYLNLDHAGDSSLLMNPIIGDSSKTLTAQQCEIARSAISQYWQRMVR